MKIKQESTLWYKDAVIYELRVRSFYDSNGDGVGDFLGLTQKLDYLQDLGVTAIWLLPFYPSPMRDDGYDISDYQAIHPDYGTLEDFKNFLEEAHRRKLKVITELVLNHTSDQHQWFQRARQDSPGGDWRNFYVWSDTSSRYRDARVIFKDFETSNWTWDSQASAYYWHRFYSHQPDLNFDHPGVRSAIYETVDFWLGMGVDGLRLDAVPYLFEREDTNCENLPETHAFLQALRHYIDQQYPNRMLLAEANQWPEDAVSYFGQGDECHVAFHFPIMPKLFMSLHMEDRFPVIDTLQQTPPIDPSCQWAIFLRNHDELTLEMVTDEERQYMYRVYAPDERARINLGIRRRLAPLLGNNRRKLELMQGLLLSLPGTPVLYYGDEIGMGDNIFLNDRNGVRTPMQWSNDRNAGFSRANSQRLPLPVIVEPEYHYETTNVEAQQNNPSSLLWWNKRFIALRKQFKAFGRGTIDFLLPPNPKILAYVRRFESETLLVVTNLSRFAQHVDLDLSKYKGCSVIELFGHTEFPPITDKPYALTLGSHSFFWFSLEPSQDPTVLTATGVTSLPEVTVDDSWKNILNKTHQQWLERSFTRVLSIRPWFMRNTHGRRIKSLSHIEEVQIKESSDGAVILFVHVEYADGSEQDYSVPLQFIPDVSDDAIPVVPPAALARLHVLIGEKIQSGYLVDAFGDTSFLRWISSWMTQRQVVKGRKGLISGVPFNVDAQLIFQREEFLEPRPIPGQQNNTSVFYGESYVLKAFRKIEPGKNPELEVGQFLTERARFSNVPRILGAIEYHPPKGDPWTLGIVHAFVKNQGTAWSYALDEVQRFIEVALVHSGEIQPIEITDWAQELMAPSLANIRLLAQRTAELHTALGSDSSDPSFSPEPFTSHYQKAIAQAMRSVASRSLTLLRGRLPNLVDEMKTDVTRILEKEKTIQEIFSSVSSKRIRGMCIRIHGDYHLGQALFTGKDFVIIDFEGDSTRSISERRIKRSPLRDVAGVLRSLRDVSHTALSDRTSGPVARPEDRPRIAYWADVWRKRSSDTFLDAYLEYMQPTGFLPDSQLDTHHLLSAFLLEKMLFDLDSEMNHRSDWVGIPIQGILDLLEKTSI